jgi:hypothetical protein
MSTANIKKKTMFLGSKVRLVRGADNLTAIDCVDNVGFLTSHNPIGLHGMLWEELYFSFYGRTAI